MSISHLFHYGLEWTPCHTLTCTVCCSVVLDMWGQRSLRYNSTMWPPVAIMLLPDIHAFIASEHLKRVKSYLRVQSLYCLYTLAFFVDSKYTPWGQLFKLHTVALEDFQTLRNSHKSGQFNRSFYSEVCSRFQIKEAILPVTWMSFF